MPKYDPLNKLFEGESRAYFVVPIAQIEAILGFEITSGRRYAAWWHSSRPHAQVWVSCGYRATLDVPAQAVKFTKGPGSKSPMNSKPKWLAKLPNRVDQFLATYQERHRRFVKAAKFSGPSLYFHHKALSAQNTAPTSFSDASYAMLVSWGMHRMGKGGAKMVAFDVYEQSLRKVAGIIRALRSLDPETIDSVVLGNLREVFFGIHAMTGKTHLVANSKVMAHALPQLIAPIDRQYTLKYLCGTNSVSISQDRNEQWEVLRATHQHFFYPICRDPGFKKAATLWVSTPASAWDTSILKVIDNCIMAGDPDDRADESPE